ncbi:MAG: excinuclease ABC subunit UvrA [Thermotogae bacterium]|nr:excinuclease ABC subunit UvrA [Thermotogota bacterium]
MAGFIRVRGAKVNNLKNIDVDIPKEKLVVITGVSGSGKSSLALETIYAEGQRKYLESLSSYARQFLGELKKPDVESIEGLSPAIAIEQKTVSHNPRSTVGTVTEIHDYLRVFYAKIGVPHCPRCGRELSKSSPEEITDGLLRTHNGLKILILSPIAQEKKGEFKDVLADLLSKGFIRVEIDGEIFRLDEPPNLDKQKRHTIKLIVDRLTVSESERSRLFDSLETALKMGNGIVEVRTVDEKSQIFSDRLACPICGIGFPEINPKLFSFNSPYGACPACHGLGFRQEIDPSTVVDPEKSVRSGAFSYVGPYFQKTIERLIWKLGGDPNKPFKDLPKRIQHAVLYGTTEKHRFDYYSENSSYTVYKEFEGIVPWLSRRYRETESEDVKEWIEREFMVKLTCERCKGKRLRDEALAVKIGGLDIAELSDMPVKRILEFLRKLRLTSKEREIVSDLLEEITRRLQFLVDVGLDYITLSRSANTLSGGEAQRIRLATQIGSGLTNVIYVLDEPTIGLHERDNDRLIHTLKKLRDLGNTVIVVEHDEYVIRSADHVVDLGPGAGVHGGEVVFVGPPGELIANSDSSLTGAYLSRKLRVEIPLKRRKGTGEFIVLKGARQNNLKSIDVRFPLGTFICVTGVSGSGKSSLVVDTLYPALRNRVHRTRMPEGEYDDVEGVEHIDKVIAIDQSPIGRTPRSNPATYTGVFDHIRELFAMTPEAKARGYKKGRFSFNVKGGRCEACQGHGVVKIEMQLLPPVYVECEVCKGKRYNSQTLEVRYKGKTIADILDMTVLEALGFFQNITKIREILQILDDVGLGYIKLGQPATTLSGGEAQRIKLATELKRRATGRTFYIMDEPTTGLHFDDVKKLVHVIHRLVDRGNTVVVIEHNMDVIKNADHIIDLGPEGGEDGGWIVAEGTPEEVALNERSYTGLFLRNHLDMSQQHDRCTEVCTKG